MKKLLAILFVLCSTYTFSEILLSGLKYKDGLYYEKGSSIPYTGVREMYAHGFRVFTIENGLLMDFKIYDTPEKNYLEEETIYQNGKEVEIINYADKGKKIVYHMATENGVRYEKSFLKNGDISEEAYFDKDGHLIGEGYKYYKKGKIKEKRKENIEKGIITIISYYENGGIYSEIESDNGPLHSKKSIKEYWENGKISYEKRDGITILYNKEGIIESSQTDKDSKGNYVIKEYDNKGNIKYTREFIDDIETCYVGDTKQLFTGKIKKYDGKIIGFRKPVLKCKYVNGLLEGKYKEYRKGEPSLKVNYVNGKKEGNMWESGYGSYSNMPYVNNKKEGVEMYYSYNSYYKKYYIHHKTTYSNNMKKGETIYYNFIGEPSMKITFNNDKRDGEYTEYRDNKIDTKGQYKDDKREGEFIEYYSNGNKKKTYSYKDGKREGVENFYHENGNLKQTCNWINDYLEGESYIYDKDGELTDVKFYDHLKGIPEKVEY